MSDHRGNPVVQVTVSGSFTKHWEQVQATVSEFERQGAEVLSPRNGPPIREDEGFIYLREDIGSADAIERRHLHAIQRSDLLYIVNPEGYLGTSVALEMGYALAWNTPIWSTTGFSDSPHNLLVRSGGVVQAIEAINDSLGDLEFPKEVGLPDLQDYVRRMARVRGFDQEKLEEILILLVEEIGELAKAMRFRLHLATSNSETSHKNIPLELADCLIYLLHLANRAEVNLLSALREKERINATKKWTTT
jgi:NTP pyrophosphatase (non-canonical NTP hydrolase)